VTRENSVKTEKPLRKLQKRSMKMFELRDALNLRCLQWTVLMQHLARLSS